MAPIAISIACGLGASADPFLMSVAIGASCAFLTPIGHQSNTLMMGPGGYKFNRLLVYGAAFKHHCHPGGGAHGPDWFGRSKLCLQQVKYLT